MKKITAILLAFLLTSLMIGSAKLEFARASTPVIGIINSDTTWTEENSPYSLNGPTAVNLGTTLTIEPGVTVNFNGYYIQVNGTFVASGSNSDKITFNDGKITLTYVSNGWDAQTGSGSRIENSILANTSIFSDDAVKLSNDEISGEVHAGNYSELSNNKITDNNAFFLGDSCKVDGNTLSGQVVVGNNVEFSHNKIDLAELVTGASCTIAYNTITQPPPSNSPFSGVATALDAGASSTITNNVIMGTITGAPSEISGNTIEGGGSYRSYFDTDTVDVPAINIACYTCTFSSNQIRGTAGTAIQAKQTVFTSNNIFGSVDVAQNSIFKSNIINGTICGGNSFVNNKIYGYISLAGDLSNISGNYIENGGVNCCNFIAQITDNTLQNSNIYNAAGTILHNLITGGAGISTGSAPVTITANTISKNTVGISVGSATPIINDNNIVDNTQNSILLTASADVNASNNWWGTTDTKSISSTIHDSKSDFNLGTVNIIPILQSSNTAAVPDPNAVLPSTNNEPTQTQITTSTPLPTPTQTHVPSPSSKSARETAQGSLSPSQFVITVLVGVIIALIIVVAFVLLLLERSNERLRARATT